MNSLNRAGDLQHTFFVSHWGCSFMIGFTTFADEICVLSHDNSSCGKPKNSPIFVG